MLFLLFQTNNTFMLPSNKILIIEPSKEIQNEFRQLLSDSTFAVEFVTSVDEGIRKSIRKRFDLILCQQDLEYISGFQVFKKLENSLLKNNTAFFLILKKFESEDVLIGLEMGIDNFIICPIQKQSVLRKIQNQLKKQKEFNFIETPRFKEIFEITPVPLFVLENQSIAEINSACQKLLNLKNYDKDKLMFTDVFNIEEDSDKMKIRKLENGLIESCKLENIKLHDDSKNVYTINKYNVSRSQGGKIFAEVIHENNANGNNGTDNSCPQNGICLKVSQLENTLLSSVKLTAREKEVFELSAKGLAIKQIAAKLHLSDRTVEKHRYNIMQKANANSFIEAIMAIQKDKWGL